ncbi:MAG TPA: mannosyltransferase family protein [Waterburya sp.]
MTRLSSGDIANPRTRSKPGKWDDGLFFVMTMWLCSRLLIIVAIQLIAPLLPVPPVNFSPSLLGSLPNYVPQPSWEVFSHWDGAWYRQIATEGYNYVNDGQQYSVAFFPLFPLLCRGLMTLGIPFNVAGTLVNNLGMLGAMLLLYRWAKERYGLKTARWVTAVLAWCPFSLYGTVIYTEGLFLWLTTAAMRAFEQHQPIKAAVWGALATATRVTGAALIPAFLWVAWRERRPAIAYAAGLAASSGLILFSIYCGIRFADPIAFVRVQRAWWQPTWFYILTHAVRLNVEDLTRVAMFFGCSFLLWHFRRQLPRVLVAFGFCCLLMLLVSGGLQSISRYVYGIVSFSLALGMLLERHPRWGYPLILLFAINLVVYALRFAWWRWVA